VQDITAKWEEKIQQMGQQIIGRLDRKMMALQAITLEGNRMANRLEVFVEHLEQTTRKRMVEQECQVDDSANVQIANVPASSAQVANTGSTKPGAAKMSQSSISHIPHIPQAESMPGTHPACDASSFTDVLQKIADITEDVEAVGKKISQSTSFYKRVELEEVVRQAEPQGKASEKKLSADLCADVEMLLNFGLKPEEIAQRLGVSVWELDLLLQVHENIDTITGIPTTTGTPVTTGTTSTPHSKMSEDFDFDGFVEADETQSTTSKVITDNFKNTPAFKIGVIGVGQCGNNIAQAFHRIGYRRVLVVNTAQTDLDSIDDQIPKLLIDKQGAGKDPEVGKMRVEAKATEIRNGMLREFGEDFEKIIVCLGLGGGTGSGGGPAVVKIARDIIRDRGGNPTRDLIVVVTLPDPNIDGPKQCFNALVAYGQVANLGVPMTIIDNAQVGSIIRTKLADGWTPINTWIARTFHMFNAYANMPSDHGAFDGNDLNDVISRGRMLFSAFRVTQLKDRYAIADTIAANLERSLFAKCDRATATAAGCLMVINPRVGKDLSMEDIAPAFLELNKIMRSDSTLHRGLYIPDWSFVDQEKHPDLFCYVILGGLDHPRVTLAGLFEKAKSHDQKYGSVEAFLAAEV